MNSRIWSVFIAWIAMICALLSMGATAIAGSISVGLQTQDWPFMWPGGKDIKDSTQLSKLDIMRWRISERTLDRYPALGAEWSIVLLRQDRDVVENFPRIRRLVAEYKKRGIQPVFRIIENPAIYDRMGEKSGPMGYDAKYFKWVRDIAENFQNDVDYYLISNEIDHDIGHNQLKYSPRVISYDQYRKVLDTAYLAIKGVNPKLKVVDHGITTLAVALAACEDLLKQGKLVDAYHLWQKTLYSRREEFGSIASFPFLFSQAAVRQRIAVARDTFLHPGPADIYQLHHYANWEALPELLAWIDARMQEAGTRRPFIATEIGYDIPTKTAVSDGQKKQIADFSKYSEEDHAETLVKDFVILLSSGTDHALYWHSRFLDVNPGTVATLYKATKDPEEFKPFLAADAFTYMAITLNGQTASNTRLLPRYQGLYEYAFTGRGKVSVLWAAAGDIMLSSQNMANVAEARDMTGKQIPLRATQPLVLTKKPVYIFWSANPPGQAIK